MPISIDYIDNKTNQRKILDINVVTSISDPESVQVSEHPTESKKEVVDNILYKNRKITVSVAIPQSEIAIPRPYPAKDVYRKQKDVYEELKKIQRNGLICQQIWVKGSKEPYVYENLIIENVDPGTKDIDYGDILKLDIEFKEIFRTISKETIIPADVLKNLTSKSDTENENKNTLEDDKGVKAALDYKINEAGKEIKDEYINDSGLWYETEIDYDDVITVYNNKKISQKTARWLIMTIDEIQSGKMDADTADRMLTGG